jgi:cell division protein FtsQ
VTRAKLALIGIVALLVAVTPLWAPLILRRMPFFRVRRIEVLGARYVAPREIVSRLQVDTMTSVWDPTEPLAARVARHPEVEHVEVERKLPGTLVVRVTERVPVALLPATNGFLVLDARGADLPIDPARAQVDAPLVIQRDPEVLKLLSAMRQRLPALYGRTSVVRRVGNDELLLELETEPVRVMRDVTVERLADIEPIENDLGKKQLRVAEIDLRYRDQVIARLQ